jgi:hypothetical protein
LRRVGEADGEEQLISIYKIIVRWEKKVLDSYEHNSRTTINNTAVCISKEL